MVAFEIFINGKKKCTAGIGKPGVVTTILNWVQADEQRGRKPSEDMELSVGGLISRSREFLEWFRRDLKRGDEIVVRVVESERADPPKTRRREDRAKQLKRKQDYVLRIAKEFGWKVKK